MKLWSLWTSCNIACIFIAEFFPSLIWKLHVPVVWWLEVPHACCDTLLRFKSVHVKQTIFTCFKSMFHNQITFELSTNTETLSEVCLEQFARPKDFSKNTDWQDAPQILLWVVCCYAKSHTNPDSQCSLSSKENIHCRTKATIAVPADCATTFLETPNTTH